MVNTLHTLSTLYNERSESEALETFMEGIMSQNVAIHLIPLEIF